jgi:serine-type D-Ala-D-Ala carboxypeptidase (penicillin-binding protein 5/6)
MDPKKNKVLFSKKADEIREMASLTKIMTTLVSLHLAQELKLNIHKHWFRVSNIAANTIGTTANLTENQRVTIHDLLYGLMLPSGNDAAMTLAEGFTELLR